MHGVGDALRDVQAAAAAGCIPHLVCTGEGEQWLDRPLDDAFPPYTVKHSDLLAFAHYLIGQEPQPQEPGVQVPPGQGAVAA